MEQEWAIKDLEGKMERLERDMKSLKEKAVEDAQFLMDWQLATRALEGEHPESLTTYNNGTSYQRLSQ